MLKRFRVVRRRALFRGRLGFTLTEIVIAIAVLAFVVASIPAAMIVVHNMQARQDERRVAEYLTRSQLEYIKSQCYIWGNVTGDCEYQRMNCQGYPICYDKVQFTENYYLDVVAIPIDKTTYQPLPVLSSPSGPYVEDQGIQQIVVSVYTTRNPGETTPVLVTTNYKVALGAE
jgi:prepilin-type N-terminal cleavage/methylation domain-containing protein